LSYGAKNQLLFESFTGEPDRSGTPSSNSAP